jgi:hypothetical protein
LVAIILTEIIFYGIILIIKLILDRVIWRIGEYAEILEY